jgi:hypothetical protein
MAKRKVKRNARTLKARGGFKICREPIVPLSTHAPSPATDSIGLPHVYGRPVLFAIARDAATIFASWNIDWQRVFQKAKPANRQVYLRIIGDDGLERKRVPIEPMAAVHYVTMSRLRDCSRVEIGYFQPIDTWHSVAISNKIEIPPQGKTEVADIDLATIPFHLSFQELLDFFGPANAAPLAKVVSQFQKRAIRSDQPNDSAEAQILRKLGMSLAQIAAAQRDFQKSDTEKLVRRTGALLQFTRTSPWRGFEGNFGS